MSETGTNQLQRARDVLAKRRKASRAAGPQDHFWTSAIDPSVKYLVMLTAGNPDMLDGIDGLLQFALVNESVGVVQPFAERIAAAIIAADERMSA